MATTTKKTAKKKMVKKKTAAKKTPAKKAMKKKAASKTVSSKKKASRKNSKIKVTSEQRHKMICEAAYFISLEKSYETVNPKEDWLQAEAYINQICTVQPNETA